MVNSYQRLFVLFLSLASVLLLLRLRWVTLLQAELGDESETIVASRMIADGSRLYSEIFQLHGPLTYLPGVLGEIIGQPGFIGNRLTLLPIEFFVFLSIVRSFRSRSATTGVVVATVIFAVIWAYLPSLYAGYLTYQYMAGLLVIVSLTSLVLPSLDPETRSNRPDVILGSVAIACLPFLAITYVPAAALFVAVTLYQFPKLRRIQIVTIGIVFALNICWLALIGSMRGYLALHWYFNISVAPGIGQINDSLLITLLNPFRYFFKDILHLFFLLGMLAFGAWVRRVFHVRKIVVTGLILGTSSLTLRGFENELQSLPFYFAFLVMLVFVLRHSTEAGVNFRISLCLVTLAIIVANLGFRDIRIFTISEPPSLVPSRSNFSLISDHYTTEEDRIISYTYSNAEYILADRLPSVAAFWLLGNSWTYLQDPVLGIGEEPCEAMRNANPKVVYLDRSGGSLFGSWEMFGACIDLVMEDKYTERNFLQPVDKV